MVGADVKYLVTRDALYLAKQWAGEAHWTGEPSKAKRYASRRMADRRALELDAEVVEVER